MTTGNSSSRGGGGGSITSAAAARSVIVPIASALLFLLVLIYTSSSSSSFSLTSFTTSTPRPLVIEQTRTSVSDSDLDPERRRHLQAVDGHCSDTLYREECVSTLSAVPNLATKSLPEIIGAAVDHAAEEVRLSTSTCRGYLHKLSRRLSPRQRLALDDCLQLFGDTIEAFRSALTDLSYTNSSIGINSAGTNASSIPVFDLQTFLSAAMTNQDTCLEGFADAGVNDMFTTVRPDVERRLRKISRMVSNSLALVTRLPKKYYKKMNKKPRIPKQAPFEGYGKMSPSGYPSWMTRHDRRLLQIAPANITTINAVVATDGTGNFTTVGAAVAAAPNNSATRYVIYIKAGGYFENVEIASNKKNLFLVGDGMDKTIIKASRNVVDGWTTFRSATVAVVGKGFMARDISFENAAGPSKHQAVALRSNSDLSVFYRCRFVGYQDTLYVHSLRQFYRECDVYGTVDFIFGNAAVVFQNCNLYARKPDPNQQNLFTAQGRDDPNQNTGISIQNCKVAAAADLLPVQGTFKTYLGRPWKLYSRTVFMQSQIDNVVDPAGWLPWNGTFALDTLYYGEYQNRGLGANTTARVTWPGYRVISNSTEAANFTVVNFIQGDQWLPATNVPFNAGLF